MSRTTKFIDLGGKRIGKLLIGAYLGKSRWECVCDCGYSFIIHTQSVTTQGQQRCKYCFYEAQKKHGGCGTPEYQAWKHMQHRCYDTEDIMYPNYGGRGIKIYEDWLGESGFLNFLSHVGKRPNKGYSIDRIDVDKNYEPGNVRWATRKEQNSNKTNTIYIEYNGESKTINDWAEITGLKSRVIRDRYHRNWDSHKILNQKLRRKEVV